MPNPSLADPKGTVTYQNNTNNWRAEDAHRLQQRAINQFTDETAFNADTYTQEGSVGYIDTGDYLVTKTAGGNKKVFLANYLSASTDSNSQVNLKHSTGTAGILIESTKISISGSGTLSTTAFQVTNGADATNVTRLSGANGLLNFDKGLKINAGGVTVDAGGLVVTAGGITVSAGGASITGTVSATAFSGPLTGAVTGNVTGNLTGLVTYSGASASQFGSLYLQNNDLRISDSSVKINLAAGGVTITTPGASSNNKFFINDGSTNPANVAGVKVDTVAPTTQDYPEGTLWVQV